ncbi:MAG: metallothionein [Cyanobacteria bacterium J06621_8]
MTSVNLVKCECGRCSCEISLENAVKKAGKYYCCDACADGHINEQGCKMSGCGCN